MKAQSLAVFRTLTLGVHATVLFSHYCFSVCCRSAKYIVGLRSLLSKSIKVAREITQSLILKVL